MKIKIIENGNVRNENVKVANRVIVNVEKNNKKHDVGIYPIPGVDGCYCDIEAGIVYGRMGYPVGAKKQDGRMACLFTIDGKAKSFLRSRLIASAALGRPLAADEEVDHINNIVDDDRLENLAICSHKDNCNNPLTKVLKKNRSRRHDRSQRLVFNAPVAEFKHFNVEKAK